jgi:hypothetical protein
MNGSFGRKACGGKSKFLTCSEAELGHFAICNVLLRLHRFSITVDDLLEVIKARGSIREILSQRRRLDVLGSIYSNASRTRRHQKVDVCANDLLDSGALAVKVY